ncbi:hypothetical protein [Paraburkholderia sediminicola]|uniref:hypothetical protein n=1 Tax=Paraburkholderia sediminicola TaxID=458836 RepID=UPI0038BD0187
MYAVDDCRARFFMRALASPRVLGALPAMAATLPPDACLAEDRPIETLRNRETRNNCCDIHPVLSSNCLFRVDRKPSEGGFLSKQSKNAQKPIGFLRFA